MTAVEQAGGYSIFANQGKHFKNHVVIKVVDKDGGVYAQEKKTPTKVISPEAAADATVALQAVVKQGTGRNAALYDRPVAGKTGTNDANKEAWFVGFTPQLSTAVGMFREQCKTKTGKIVNPVNDRCPVTRGTSTKYNDQNPYSSPFETPLGSNFQGATYPAAIWKTFMTEAMKGQKVEQFPPRADSGMTENLAPKPTPTPTATVDPFPDDDSACGLLDPACNDDNVSIDPNEQGIPEDDDGMMGGGTNPTQEATVPDPIPSRREDR